MSYTQSVAVLIGIGIVSLAAFVVVTIIAWPSNVIIARRFVAFVESIPFRWRMFRDPEFRRAQLHRAGIIAKYDGALMVMMMAQAQVLSLEREPTDRPEARERRLRAARDGLAEAKRAAVELFLAIEEADLPVVAEHVAAEWFDGKIPVEEVAAFLKEERELFGRNVHAAPQHMQRAIMRFGPRVAPAE